MDVEMKVLCAALAGSQVLAWMILKDVELRAMRVASFVGICAAQPGVPVPAGLSQAWLGAQTILLLVVEDMFIGLVCRAWKPRDENGEPSADWMFVDGLMVFVSRKKSYIGQGSNNLKDVVEMKPKRKVSKKDGKTASKPKGSNANELLIGTTMLQIASSALAFILVRPPWIVVLVWQCFRAAEAIDHFVWEQSHRKLETNDLQYASWRPGYCIPTLASKGHRSLRIAPFLPLAVSLMELYGPGVGFPFVAYFLIFSLDLMLSIVDQRRTPNELLFAVSLISLLVSRFWPAISAHIPRG